MSNGLGTAVKFSLNENSPFVYVNYGNYLTYGYDKVCAVYQHCGLFVSHVKAGYSDCVSTSTISGAKGSFSCSYPAAGMEECKISYVRSDFQTSPTDLPCLLVSADSLGRHYTSDILRTSPANFILTTSSMAFPEEDDVYLKFTAPDEWSGCAHAFDNSMCSAVTSFSYRKIKMVTRVGASLYSDVLPFTNNVDDIAAYVAAVEKVSNLLPMVLSVSGYSRVNSFLSGEVIVQVPSQINGRYMDSINSMLSGKVLCISKYASDCRSYVDQANGEMFSFGYADNSTKLEHPAPTSLGSAPIFLQINAIERADYFDPPSDSGANVGLIVGMVFLAVFLCGVGVGGLLYYRKRRYGQYFVIPAYPSQPEPFPPVPQADHCYPPQGQYYPPPAQQPAVFLSEKPHPPVYR